MTSEGDQTQKMCHEEVISYKQHIEDRDWDTKEEELINKNTQIDW